MTCEAIKCKFYKCDRIMLGEEAYKIHATGHIFEIQWACPYNMCGKLYDDYFRVVNHIL
jgi:hypothetical protein